MIASRFLQAFFVLTLLATAPAQADITRSCSASVDVYVSDK